MLLPLLANLGMFGIAPPVPSLVTGGISRVVQQAKAAEATVRLGFDFLSKLRSGEWIESVDLGIFVYKGEAAASTLVLEGSPTILRTGISQLLSGGDRGTVYFIECIAQTNLGRKPYLTSYLTVR